LKIIGISTITAISLAVFWAITSAKTPEFSSVENIQVA
jgi:hypothetical protein